MNGIKITRAIVTLFLTVFLCLTPLITFINAVAGWLNNLPQTYNHTYFTLLKTVSIISLLIIPVIIALNLLGIFGGFKKHIRIALASTVSVLVFVLIVFFIVARAQIPTAYGYWTTDCVLYISAFRPFMISMLIYTIVAGLVAHMPVLKK
jgi:hypothetical protein